MKTIVKQKHFFSASAFIFILVAAVIGVHWLLSDHAQTPSAHAAPSVHITPPVTWCENGLPASPYTSAPKGAVIVPAGDDSSFDSSNPNTTYWFAPGTHINLSVEAADGDTYLGAPGAIINGGNNIQYAFQGSITTPQIST